MAEPKKETVRIALPPRPDAPSSPVSTAKNDTARIVLPSRTPLPSIRRLPPKITALPKPDSLPEPSPLPERRPPLAPLSVSPAPQLFQPLPKPPGPAVLPAPIAPDDAAAPQPAAESVQPGPKKETARIHAVPAPTRAINMTKTQPLLSGPAPTVQPAPVIIAPRPLDPFDAIPRSFCWALFGIAALIFLIQIWNYVVS